MAAVQEFFNRDKFVRDNQNVKSMLERRDERKLQELLHPGDEAGKENSHVRPV